MLKIISNTKFPNIYWQMFSTKLLKSYVVINHRWYIYICVDSDQRLVSLLINCYKYKKSDKKPFKVSREAFIFYNKNHSLFILKRKFHANYRLHRAFRISTTTFPFSRFFRFIKKTYSNWTYEKWVQCQKWNCWPSATSSTKRNSRWRSEKPFHFTLDYKVMQLWASWVFEHCFRRGEDTDRKKIINVN